MEDKYKEQPKIAVNGTEHTVRTTENKFLHREILSTTLKFQRPPTKDVSPNKHTMRGKSKKCVSALEEAQKIEEGTISAAEPRVRKVKSDKEDSDFECYSKSDGKPLHGDIDKEATEAVPALTLLPNRPEGEEININVEIMGGNGNISVRRSD